MAPENKQALYCSVYLSTEVKCIQPVDFLEEGNSSTKSCKAKSVLFRWLACSLAETGLSDEYRNVSVSLESRQRECH